MVGKYQKLFWKRNDIKNGIHWVLTEKTLSVKCPKLKCDFYTIIVVHKEKEYEP